ncbi:hypothetical protein IJI69_04400 [Candidatus Saccharibacteria bacterium]|nr:hypothetical protein [Candidatus Saccharibacteria bacterium]
MEVSKLVTDYAIKHEDKAEFLHTSGYAKAQSGENIGAASTASFEARKALDDQRKYIKSYKASKIGTARYQGLKPAVYKPEKTNEEKGQANTHTPQSGSSLRYSAIDTPPSL